MRRLALGLISVLISGCFNPDDIFPVHGSVVSPDGVEGLTVELLRDSSTTLGAPTCEQGTPFKTTTTDAEGRFTFDLFRAQTQSLSGRGLHCFRVQVTFPSGATARTDLPAIGSEVNLPAFTDWRAAPRLEGGLFRFEPVTDLVEAEDAGQLIGHRLELLTTDGGLAWRAEDMVTDPVGQFFRTTLRFDDARLEDFSGALRLTALVPGVRSDAPVFGEDSSAVWLQAAETVALTGTQVPLSRGLPCDSVATPCPLTDGDLAQVELGVRQSLSFEFPSEVDAGTLVLRGLQTLSPTFGVQFFAADGGRVQALSFAGPLDELEVLAPFGLIESNSVTVRPLRDGGVMLGDVPARYVALPVTPVAPITRVVLRFSAGVQELAEFSVY